MAADFGSDRTITVTPATGYHVADVVVDGVSVGAVNGYTFTNVTADHTIAATFAIDTFTLTATAGAHGAIDPAGATVRTTAPARRTRSRRTRTTTSPTSPSTASRWVR